MAATLTKPVRIRLLCDVDNYSNTLPNLAEGSTAAVEIPIGATLQFELAAFDSSAGTFSDTSKIDFTTVVDVVIALQDQLNPHNALTYWSVTIANANINNSMTAANWLGAAGNGTNGTDQQIKQVISSFQNSIIPAAAVGNGQYFLCIYAITNGANKLYATSTAFSKGDIIYDTNNNAQQCTTAGTTGGSAPSWATTLGATTSDGGVTWTRVTAQKGTVPFAGFPVSLVDTGLPILLTNWVLPGPDGLLHEVSVGQDANKNFILEVEQTGFAGTAFSAPLMACSDGVYRTPTLVQSGSVIILTLQ